MCSAVINTIQEFENLDREIFRILEKYKVKNTGYEFYSKVKIQLSLLKTTPDNYKAIYQALMHGCFQNLYQYVDFDYGDGRKLSEVFPQELINIIFTSQSSETIKSQKIIDKLQYQNANYLKINEKLSTENKLLQSQSGEKTLQLTEVKQQLSDLNQKLLELETKLTIKPVVGINIIDIHTTIVIVVLIYCIARH